MDKPKNGKISFGEKIGFSIGEYSSSLVWQSLMFFLPIFYTDTFGLSATALATMFLLVRIFDAFTDPVMGMIADRTETRWGKFRPYVLWLAVPYGVGTVLMFTTPGFEGTAKIVYAYVTYSIMMVLYTAISIPYNSLIGVISPIPEERTSVSSYKFVFAYAAGFSIQLLTIPLVNKFGAGNPQKGYQLTMAVFAVVAIVFFLISFFSVKERVKPDPGQKTEIKNDLKDLMNNRPWIILFFLSLATLIYVAIRSADIAYFFKYYVGDEASAGKFMATGTAFVLLGVLPTKWLSSFTGKKNLYIICMLLITASSALFIVVKPGDMVLLYTLQIIFSLASGPTMPLLWSMLADSADYSEWKNNRRATGLIFSAATFAQKAGFSLGGALVMAILGSMGFVANEMQDAGSIMGIRISLSIIPAIVALAGAILLFFYNLDEKTVKKIEAELAERKSAIQ